VIRADVSFCLVSLPVNSHISGISVIFDTVADSISNCSASREV
jgi:hypothetical protein